jgi:phage gp37-like protein
VEGQGGQEVPIFKLYDASGNRLVYVYRRNGPATIYVVYNGTTNYTGTKFAPGTWGDFVVHTVTAGAGSTVEVTMSDTSIWRTTTASLGMSGIRTIQIGNDKQLPFALYTDNIQAHIWTVTTTRSRATVRPPRRTWFPS